MSKYVNDNWTIANNIKKWDEFDINIIFKNKNALKNRLNY